jgi:hypothetical protein
VAFGVEPQGRFDGSRFINTPAGRCERDVFVGLPATGGENLACSVTAGG